MAYVEQPDRLRRVGAAVAVLLLLVAALLAGIIAWELLRTGDNDASPTVASVPQATVALPPAGAAAPEQGDEALVIPPAADTAVTPVPIRPDEPDLTVPTPETEVVADPPAADEPEPAPAVEAPQIAALGPGPLRPAPDPAVLEQSTVGPLPRISPEGLEPWRVYARPFDASDLRPRVAVVVSGLGLSKAATEAAIQGLPGGVTLGFQPYADNLQRWIGLSRAAGHETMLNLPMEPFNYPQSDPGPQALFTSLSPQENVQRLEWVLSRVTGYVGVMNLMGSRFMTAPEAMDPVMAELGTRGLLFVDDGVAGDSVGPAVATNHGVPHAIGDRFVDIDEISRVAIDRQLAEVERIAQEVGAAVAVAQPYPVSLERLREWIQTLDEKGIALAPVSAVVNLQVDR